MESPNEEGRDGRPPSSPGEIMRTESSPDYGEFGEYLTPRNSRDTLRCEPVCSKWSAHLWFSDCSDIVTKEIMKMESTFCSITMTIRKKKLELADYPQWEGLLKFLEESNCISTKSWLTPHTDMEVECQTRESDFLHFTNRLGFELKGSSNRCVMLRELPRLIPQSMSVCYFVGNRDCRTICPGVVPRVKNNVIVYRTRADANAANEELGPTQYYFFRPSLDFDGDSYAESLSTPRRTPSTST
ncbi:unnamed protein product [Bursaphelenchus xylophilus]|uniref:(pine wood nematode) hypothetical protein n=1 Tax=Bursaphelenchus xylophilus TaxID=6326 RepID=A0A1I7S7B9_BURXY|nr:unnamed protein product [Bursaphelenchus xylophilus]CAG9084885.1 unnamed protein product [Bursaphelenchus xylophilus]